GVNRVENEVASAFSTDDDVETSDAPRIAIVLAATLAGVEGVTAAAGVGVSPLGDTTACSARLKYSAKSFSVATGLSLRLTSSAAAGEVSRRSAFATPSTLWRTRKMSVRARRKPNST